MAQSQIDDGKGLLNAVPAWGSYLYQNFLVPAFSPTASMSEWLNLNTPFGALTPRAAAASVQASNQQQLPGAAEPSASPIDYFGSTWRSKSIDADAEPASIKLEPGVTSQLQSHRYSEPTQPSGSSIWGTLDVTINPFTGVPQTRSQTLPTQQAGASAGPSYIAPTFGYSNSSIPTSLLMNADFTSSAAPSGGHAFFTVGSALKGTSAGAEAAAVSAAAAHHGVHPSSSLAGPSAPSSRNITPSLTGDLHDGRTTHSPSPMTSAQHTPHMSPKRGAKRRCDSLDSEEHSEHEHEHEHEVPEGVERDGMIWGMKVDEYKALSARERKRVRNRISARTFRAKRKEHLSSLEVNMGTKELKLRLATEEASRLRNEVAELKRRLARYEAV